MACNPPPPQVEFQIPNVHPSWAAKVTYGGRVNITVFDQEIETDLWEWKFSLESFKVYTNPCATCVNNVTLHQWTAHIETQDFSIQFQNFTGISTADAPAFDATFKVPAVCNQATSCDNKPSAPAPTSPRVGPVETFSRKYLAARAKAHAKAAIAAEQQ